MKTVFSVFIFLGLSASFVTAAARQERKMPDALFEKLGAFHTFKKEPGPDDWLANHYEPGQSFADYTAAEHLLPDEDRRTIYITLLGDFDTTRRKIIEQTAEFIEAYFQMPVRFADPISASRVPDSARRVHPVFGERQILTRYVIEELLVPATPDDAYALIAFTPSDLWPGEGWNFVFGEASMPDRVGVWSIYRNGIPTKSEKDYTQTLLRTVKTGTHELAHMFGIHHCIYYECAMNGSNHRAESDKRPLYLCPVDLKKLYWATGFDINGRFEQLEALSQKFDFERATDYYNKVKNIH